jgi:large subunit ribosomal protein L6
MASRVAKKPIPIPAGVEISVANGIVTVKGPKGENKQELHAELAITIENGEALVETKVDNLNALAGTIRSIVNNHVMGVSQGFEKKLRLVGVGYRGQAGKAKDGRSKIDLTLGLSHPVTYVAPKGIEISAPSATDITVSGIDKQLVGQVAADIRGIHNGVRKPEPYKGKGIRYADEKLVLKEAKKK